MSSAFSKMYPPAVGKEAEASRNPPATRGQAARYGFEAGLSLNHADEAQRAAPGMDAGVANDRRTQFVMQQMARGMSRTDAQKYWDATEARTLRAQKAGRVQEYRAGRDAAREAYPITYGASEVAGNVLLAAPAVAAAPGVAPVVAGGAILGGIDAMGRGDGQAGAVDVGVGAAAGGAGALIGIPLAALTTRAVKFFGRPIAAMFSKPALYDAATGQFTEAGQRSLQAMGVDPARVTQQLAQAFESTAQTATRGGGDPQRMALAESFGIPLSKGQATNQVPQIASEEAMRAGARGQGAYDAMTGFDARQRSAVEAAKEGVMPNPAGIDPVDAAEAVVPRVQARAGEAKAGAQQAYKAFEDMGGGIRGQAVNDLKQSVAQTFKRESIQLTPDMTNAKAAVAVMDDMLSGAERGAIPFEKLERTRQKLRMFSSAAIKGSNGQDQMAMKALMNEYDGWLERAFDSAIVDGSKEALDQVKGARKLWGAYLKTFTGKKGADNYIRKIVEDDLDPNQVVGWLFGQSKNIGGAQSGIFAKRLRGVLGADSEEFNMLRQAAWQRMTTNGDAMRGTDDMASALREFLYGKGKPLAKELFTPPELARINEFRQALEVLRKPQKATNPSGSGYEVGRAVMAAAQAASTALGFQAGGVGGAMAGRAVPGVLGGWKNALAARAAAAGIKGSPPPIFSPLGATNAPVVAYDAATASQ